MSTTTNLSTLKINYLTQAQYDEAYSAGTINDDELYFTPATTATTTSAGLMSAADKLILDNMIDTIYPVGAYYHTSDSDFDPNAVWGGTWSLLGEGQVLLSAGSNYTAGTQYGENTHLLTDAEVAHGHSFTNPVYTVTEGGGSNITGGNHRHGMAEIWSKSSGGSDTAYAMASNRVTMTRYTEYTSSHTHTLPNHTHTVTRTANGSVANLSGASSTRTAHNNMQLSTAVYIWHRTA